MPVGPVDRVRSQRLGVKLEPAELVAQALEKGRFAARILGLAAVAVTQQVARGGIAARTQANYQVVDVG